MPFPEPVINDANSFKPFSKKYITNTTLPGNHAPYIGPGSQEKVRYDGEGEAGCHLNIENMRVPSGRVNEGLRPVAFPNLEHGTTYDNSKKSCSQRLKSYRNRLTGSGYGLCYSLLSVTYVFRLNT